MCFATLLQFHHYAFRIVKIEHGQTPHFPISISGMRIIRVFESNRLIIFEAIFNLLRDLLVRKIRQKRKTSLSDTHESDPFRSDDRDLRHEMRRVG